MIPVKLQLTNFLSYQNTAVLDFQSLHLAGIAGLNGAGKSSIIDGMTWALFGKSRSKSDDDVVNRRAAKNDDTAEIIFDFELDNQIYRLMRRKRVRKAMKVELQVAVDYEAGEWKTLTRAKRRETDTAVEELLRMNYDTFTNASFLLQGQADEFTTKTAGQRKEILADLLGVNEWETYRETAANRRKAEENSLTLLDGQLGEIERELAEEPARKTALEAAQGERDRVSRELKTQETLLNQVRQTAELIKQQTEAVRQQKTTLTRTRRQVQELETTRDEKQKELARYEAILAEGEQIQANYAAWQAAEATFQAWQSKADAFHRLQNEMHPLENKITEARSRLRQQASHLEAEKKRVAQMRDERETLTAEQKSVQADLDQLEKALAELAATEAAHEAARQALQSLTLERNQVARELKQVEADAANIEKIRIDLKQQEALQASTEQKLVEVTQALVEITAVQEQLATLKNEASGREAEQPLLREQMTRIQTRIDQLKEAGDEGECPLCGQALSQTHQASVIAELQEEGRTLGDHFRGNKSRLQEIGTELSALEKQVKEKGKLERAQKQHQQALATAVAQISELGRRVASWEAEGVPRLAELTAQMADDTAVVAQQKEVDTLATALAPKKEKTAAHQQKQKRFSQIEARLEEIEKGLTRWESTGESQLSTVNHSLSTDAVLPEAQTSLLTLQQQAAEVGYVAEAHETARQARDTLKKAPERHKQWEQANTAVDALNSTLETLHKQLGNQQETLTEQETQLATTEKQLNTLTSGQTIPLNKLEDEVHILREGHQEAERRVGRAQQDLFVLDNQRQRRTQFQTERRELTERIQQLKMLEEACGRNGVQALLIERALPEIEDYANTLLERLTGGRMRVEFVTEKQLKTRKDTAETLDIRIADEAGVRPYENYSGGEQFRVNFAIRLALSHILAKRAGARLQTLVIDEGFGSQDPEGRQKLVEAINTIQDDFARVLVITHVEELKDAFPSRIDIVKTPQGSQIQVTA